MHLDLYKASYAFCSSSKIMYMTYSINAANF